eukprot:TRINITY_DN3122_c0_g2_i2.p2 TRINITY_DN3122_c0_g2~~TRINITY_DN3122_c0_g2_i2.p2  ORF type:complete len:106 (+),score=23.09 TRINITY_DN3122_c0_g2_i2:109-426(+)
MSKPQRFPFFANAFPMHKAAAADIGNFVLGANLKTLPKRFGDAYFNTFVRRAAAGGQGRPIFWPFLHAIGICGTVGFLIHQKHAKYGRKKLNSELTMPGDGAASH